MELLAHPVADEVPHHGKPLRLNRLLDGVAEVAHADARLQHANPLEKGITGCMEELSGNVGNPTHGYAHRHVGNQALLKRLTIACPVPNLFWCGDF